MTVWAGRGFHSRTLVSAGTALARYLPLFSITGIYLLLLSLAMLPPAITGYIHGEPDWYEFLYSFGLTFTSGLLLTRVKSSYQYGLGIRTVFLLTVSVWCVVSLYAALPFLLIEHISLADAVFETISGITTTGATVLNNLEQHDYSILLWRSLLQWMGGIGFVITGIALLPILRVGGMRLFWTESSDWTAPKTAGVDRLARSIVLLYLVITIACALAFLAAGMTAFEAVNHAMTTVSTGGFSTSDGSLGNFSPAAHWVACVFMLLGSLPFILLLRGWRRRSAEPLMDAQVRGFLLFLAIVITVIALWLQRHSEYGLLDSLRLCAVNIISVVSTTGFTVTDYSSWGVFPMMVFLLLTTVGGCSGSTAGGVKIFRFQVAGLFLRQELMKLVHPRITTSFEYNRQRISPELMRSLVAFSWAYLCSVGVIALLLALSGLDPLTSLSGALTALANVGPGMGDVIGPANNFSALHEYHKWVLSVGMLLGRLEIITVLVIFFPPFWYR